MKNNDANDSIIFKHNLRIKTMVMLCLTVISTALFVIFALLSVKRPEFTLCFYIFLLFVFIFFFLTYICDKKENKYKLPPIDNIETLNDYLKFFINNKISNFKYALTLSWISKLIVEAKNSPEIEQNQELVDYIMKLYGITKPYGSSNGYCLATYRRKAFINLINKIINKTDIPLDYENFKNDDSNIDLSDRAFILHNLSVLVFITIIIVHIASIIVYVFWGTSEVQSKPVYIEIIHEFATILPSDILVLLIYFGLVKETKIEK